MLELAGHFLKEDAKECTYEELSERMEKILGDIFSKEKKFEFLYAENMGFPESM